jgi:hypothetical protein
VVINMCESNMPTPDKGVGATNALLVIDGESLLNAERRAVPDREHNRCAADDLLTSFGAQGTTRLGM